MTDSNAKYTTLPASDVSIQVWGGYVAFCEKLGGGDSELYAVCEPPVTNNTITPEYRSLPRNPMRRATPTTWSLVSGDTR